ncbi:MAG: SDR family oxidoreductase [Gemmatimonadota bacterium]
MKTALVTGGALRLGAAMVRRLATRGWRVALHYNSSAEEAARLAEELRAGGAAIDLHQADLSRADAPDVLVDEVLTAAGSLDLLVNSAASFVRTPLPELTPEVWDSIFNVNLRAPFFLAMAASRVMKDGAQIINFGDVAAFEVWPAYLPHALAKGGVLHFTRSLAQLFAPRVRVNAISPGVVLLPEGFDNAEAVKLATATPLRRNGSPDDVVRALEYLIDATFVTGEVLVVDGGRRIRRG